MEIGTIILLICLLVGGVGGFVGDIQQERERERFLKLSIEEQERVRGKCTKKWGYECRLKVYQEPTQEELKKVKNEQK